ncbi:ABC transporter substrate-binding protein [Paenibacillus periandrae]|uniref:ABC transporter substrate-binding protein n=1 Tax=Paenibacillus periandrae TaxID=1761741 RepID=UPI001F093ADA|nr:ABC transporter substrate-binding protein [Paenibacillus periandrae]
MYTRFNIMLFTFMVIMALSGCSDNSNSQIAGPKAADVQAESPTTITIATTQDSMGDKLDAATYNGTRHAHASVYDALLDYQGKGELSPSLAESWDIAEDGLTYSFHLRRNVKFSDGNELTSEAVKFSLERAVKQEANAPLEISQKLAKIETPDKYTAILTFKETAPQTLLELSQARPFRIMSPDAVSPRGAIEGEFKKAIGTGPWQVGSYKKGTETVLVANPYYWRDKPSPYSLVLKVITDPQARVLALQNGEVDLAGGEMGNLPLENIPLFENNKNFKIETNSSTMSYFLVINQKNEFLADKNIRQAINYGTDTSKMMNGKGAEVRGLFQKNVAFVTDSNQPAYGYHPDKAKQLLEASGYRWNASKKLYEKNGKPIQLKLVIQTTEYPEWKEMAEIFQDNMKQIGIQVEVLNQERAAYYNTLWKTKEYDLMIYRTYTDAQLPYRFLSSLFYNTDKVPAVAYQDDLLNGYLDSIAKTHVKAKQQPVFDQIFARIHDEAMTVPIFYMKQTFIHSSKITGFSFGTIEDDPVQWHKLQIEGK